MSLSDICVLFARKGGRAYEGEGVTQLEHALQTAAQAEAAGSPPALIAAALLHDLGHLLNDQGETPTLRGVDDVHQFAALPFLDRKSTRLNSSHSQISYAVFCLKKTNSK